MSPKTVDQLRRFPELCEAVFGTLLSSHGFRSAEHQAGADFASQFFVNGSRYVEVCVNLDPRDAPFYCLVALGDGSRIMPEQDWNSVALWRFTPERREASITGPEQIEPTLTRLAADLGAYAADFLRGDLQRFLHTRAEQTQSREPYTISEPDQSGRYVSRPDPVSLELKRRFSESQ